MSFDLRKNAVRSRMEPWTRPALDILAFLLWNDDYQQAMKKMSRDEVKNLITGVISRLDPYKAPEQYDLSGRELLNFLWGELHGDH